MHPCIASVKYTPSMRLVTKLSRRFRADDTDVSFSGNYANETAYVYLSIGKLSDRPYSG